jgi:ATP/maltotriose-dependent transcriptional regulator MalT
LHQRLLDELGPAQVIELHRKAATWFGNRISWTRPYVAQQRAGDDELADRLVGQRLRGVLNREDRPTLERWLHLLPKEFIRRRPWLLMAEAFSLQVAWQFGAQSRVIEEVEALIVADGGGLSTHGGPIVAPLEPKAPYVLPPITFLHIFDGHSGYRSASKQDTMWA